MTMNQLADLQDRVAQAAPDDLANVVLSALVLAWPPTEVMPALDPDLAHSFDKALALIERTLPKWGVALDNAGAASGGWTCALRDTGLRDDDEVIGIGRGATASLSMIVALLQVLIIRSNGYA